MTAAAPSGHREQTWRPLEARRAQQLVDARLQLHHAAQLVAGLGISYLPKRDDDSHTNMEWLPAVNALASNAIGPDEFRLAVRPRNLNLIALVADSEVACFRLATRTLGEAVEWVRRTTVQNGLDADRYTLAKHYTIPPHAVGEGRPFDAADREEFEQLDHWFADAALMLQDVASNTPNASAVRCWPDHFDIATLIDLGNGRSVGVGLEPGDQYYAEPYWYVNSNPPPPADAPKPPLDGGGLWHAQEWTGAVLPGSRLDAADQKDQVSRFTASAIAASVALATHAAMPR
ncbi:MAG TPA: hypothetical protein VH277_02135 [Gemmatimonadaceae bacterium]|jgi:hypothetical protein|nr:hypothetical protein [Gemmatimonadaceae bacterium]